MFIGAFIGSVIFVISAKDYPLLIRVLLCLVSFVVGLISCDFFASLISAFLPGSVSVGRMIGAIVSSAVSVRLLMALTQRASDPDNLIVKGMKGAKLLKCSEFVDAIVKHM